MLSLMQSPYESTYGGQIILHDSTLVCTVVTDAKTSSVSALATTLLFAI